MSASDDPLRPDEGAGDPRADDAMTSGDGAGEAANGPATNDEGRLAADAENDRFEHADRDRPEDDERGQPADTAHDDHDDGEPVSPLVDRRQWHRHPLLRAVMTIAVALLGATLGVLIGGHTTANIGPLHASADLLVGPGDTTLRIPPLGALEVDAFDGPVRLQMTVLTVDQEKAEAYVNGTKSLDELAAQVESDVKAALTSLLVKTVIWAVVGAAIACLLIFRKVRHTLVAIGLTVALIGGVLGIGYLTFEPKALQKPTYTGLLSQAPALIGNVDNLAEKFADYRKSLVKMLTNVSTLYTAVSNLPSDPGVGDVVKVLHVSDIHMSPSGFDLITSLVEQFKIDIVVDTGDIVDWGTPQESATFASVAALPVPYIYIRGNHDSYATQETLAGFPNVTVLDDSETTVDGITFVGVGDPRFSPDRTTYDDSSLNEAATVAAKKFAKFIDSQPETPDVILFHDPIGAKELKDSGPLILSGHKHKRNVEFIDKDTMVMTQGSTGGAGLRGLEGEDPTPLSASIL